ncbi:MAG: hypothetical protein KDK65_04010 [Chlamydiia bacterium]|nr:hypothetical protein [Chlamydiia bacterium]
MICWNCGKETTPFPHNLVPFKATCDHCQAYLHCCKNCQFYQPGLPNDCRVPGTDPISNREKFNLCDEFALAGKAPPPKVNPDDVAKRLFKD